MRGLGWAGAALALLLGAGPAAAAETAVASRVDTVTVYPGGIAVVERVARVRLERGSGTLRFDGLASATVADSLRVAIESGPGGEGDVRLAGATLGREAVADPERPRERELRDRLAELEAERAVERDRVATAKTRQRFVEGLAELPRQEGAFEALAGAEAAERWPELWRTIAEGAADARAARRDAEHAVERLGEEIEALERRIDALGGGRREVVRATVALESARAGEATLRLRYRVRGPRWTPRYEARLDSRAGELELVRRASVRQATGTDWTDVRLRLATGEPVRGPVPDLAPWWIDFAGQPGRGAKAEISGMARAPADAAGASSGARTTGSEFATTYAVAGRVSVPGSNEPRAVRLGARALDAEPRVRVVPQHAERAWLVAQATWSGKAPLPAGPLERYRDGQFMGSTRLDGWAPGERREIGFGVDPAIEVAFARLADESGESGIIDKRATRTRHYRLRLTSRHARPLPATVRFRLPVARAEAIEVTPWLPDAPDARDVDDRRGVVEWRTTLEPDSERSLRMGYQVTYPRDRRVPGF